MLDVKAYQAWDETAVESVVLSNLIPRSLDALRGFAEYVAEREPQVLDRMLNALQERWEALNATFPACGIAAYPCDVDEPSWIQEYPGLCERVHGFMRSCLGCDELAWTSEQPTKVLQTQLTLAFYLPRYLMLKSLVDVLGREKGIKHMKQFLDWQIARLPKPASPPETIKELRDGDIPWNLNDGGQNAVSALVSEHQCMKKVTACRIQKVLEPYGDSDLMDVIACYPDFASIRRTNKHFALTRTQNLIQGADYCDTCFHDARGAAAIIHPSREVFDGLEERG